MKDRVSNSKIKIIKIIQSGAEWYSDICGKAEWQSDVHDETIVTASSAGQLSK